MHPLLVFALCSVTGITMIAMAFRSSMKTADDVGEDDDNIVDEDESVPALAICQ